MSASPHPDSAPLSAKAAGKKPELRVILATRHTTYSDTDMANTAPSSALAALQPGTSNPKPASKGVQTRQKRVLPTRSRRGGMGGPGVGSCDVDVMILETRKRRLEGEPLIPVSTKFLLTTNSALVPPVEKVVGLHGDSELNRLAYVRYFDRPEVQQAYQEQQLIETPEFTELPDEGSVAGRFRPRGTSEEVADTSDAAYEKRHRKYETFEKRQRLREKEKLKHEQYKLKERIEQLRGMEASAFLALPTSYFSDIPSETPAETAETDRPVYMELASAHVHSAAAHSEGERRRKEMLDIANGLEERYRVLLPPDRKWQLQKEKKEQERREAEDAFTESSTPESRAESAEGQDESSEEEEDELDTDEEPEPQSISSGISRQVQPDDYDEGESEVDPEERDRERSKHLKLRIRLPPKPEPHTIVSSNAIANDHPVTSTTRPKLNKITAKKPTFPLKEKKSPKQTKLSFPVLSVGDATYLSPSEPISADVMGTVASTSGSMKRLLRGPDGKFASKHKRSESGSVLLVPAPPRKRARADSLASSSTRSTGPSKSAGTSRSQCMLLQAAWRDSLAPSARKTQRHKTAFGAPVPNDIEKVMDFEIPEWMGLPTQEEAAEDSEDGVMVHGTAALNGRRSSSTAVSSVDANHMDVWRQGGLRDSKDDIPHIATLDD